MENENKLPPPKSKHFNLFALGFCFCALILCVVGFNIPSKEIQKMQDEISTRELVMASLHNVNEELLREKTENEAKIQKIQKRIDEIILERPKNSKRFDELAQEKAGLINAINILQGKK